MAPRRRCPAGPSCCGAGLLSPGTVPCTAKNFVQELCLVRMQNVYDQSSGTLSGWVMRASGGLYNVLFLRMHQCAKDTAVQEDVHGYYYGSVSYNQQFMLKTNLEEEVHAPACKEPLAVHRSLVRHVPHRRPGRLHHIVADARLQLHSVRMLTDYCAIFGKTLIRVKVCLMVRNEMIKIMGNKYGKR